MAHDYFLCYFIFTSYLVASQAPQYKLEGQNAKLTPYIPGQPEQILWKHDGDKVVEFDGSEERVYSTYEKRITLDWHSAELSINDLQHHDSGDYDLEAVINTKLYFSYHKVFVIDEVEEPTISCVMNDGSSSNNSENQATLSCSSKLKGPPSLMKFDWRTLGEVQHGPVLNVSLQGRSDDSVYTCRVSTPLNEKTATFTAKDCYQEESSSVALIVGLVSLLLLCVIALCVGINCYRQRQKAKTCEEEEGIKTAHKEESSKPIKPTEDNRELLDNQENSCDETVPKKGYVEKMRRWFENLSDRPVDEHRVQQKNTHQHEEKQTLLDEDKGKNIGQKRPNSLEVSENKQSDLQQPTTPEQQAHEKKPRQLEEDRPTDDATLPSPQRLHGMSQSHPDPDPENPACNHKKDADPGQVIVPPTELQKRPDSDSSDVVMRNEPESDGELEVSAENKQPDLQLSTTPEEPGSERKADENEKTVSPLASTVTPQPPHDPDMEPEEASSEHKENEDSKPLEENVSELHSSDFDKRNELDNSNEDQHKEDPDTNKDTTPPTEKNVPESDRSGCMEKNKPDSAPELEDSTEEKQPDLPPSSTREQSSPENTQDLNASQEEPNNQETTKSNQQENPTPVFESENQSDRSDVLSDSFSRLTVSDKHNNTNTVQDPTDQEQESNTARGHDFGECEGASQTDLYTAEADKGEEQSEPQNDEEKDEVQPDQKEMDSESMSELNQEKKENLKHKPI